MNNQMTSLLSETRLNGISTLLEPLSESHLPGLRSAIRDGELWKIKETVIPHPDDLQNYYIKSRQQQLRGNELVFAIIDRTTRTITGCTRFRCINFEHKKAVIGPTFIAKSWHGSHINIESKYLMIKHAFEIWSLNRIEILCDVNNHQSRRAIRKLGAQEEGILRAHRVMPDGRLRDTVIHSILSTNWSTIQPNLLAKVEERALLPLSA